MTGDLADIRARVTSLYRDVLMLCTDKQSPWSGQLLGDVQRLIGTVEWLAGDIERRRLDDIEKANGR